MDKLTRARIIKGQVQSLDRRQGKTIQNDTNSALPEMRLIEVAGHWQATITRDHVRARASEGDVAARGWDLLSLHAEGELKLALRFLDDQLEVILFKPGLWEIWFATYDPTDREPVAPSS